MPVIAIIGSLAVLILSPLLASRAMGLRGGLGKAALVAFVTAGLMQIITMVASMLGPMGDMLALMGSIAAWYQVVRVTYGTDTASTVVFIFWHLFFQLLLLSLLSLLIGGQVFDLAWPMFA